MFLFWFIRINSSFFIFFFAFLLLDSPAFAGGTCILKRGIYSVCSCFLFEESSLTHLTLQWMRCFFASNLFWTFNILIVIFITGSYMLLMSMLGLLITLSEKSMYANSSKTLFFYVLPSLLVSFHRICMTKGYVNNVYNM